MKTNFLFLLILAIIFLNSCATTRNIELTAVALPDQKTDPYGAVVSEKRHLVSISEYNEIPYLEDNVIFDIILENCGEEPLTIGNENISAIFGGYDKKKRTVKVLNVLSEAELKQDIEYAFMKMVINYLGRINRVNDSFSATSMDGENAEVFFTRIFSGNRLYVYPLVLGLEKTFRKLKTLKETLPDLILSQKTIMPRESISVLISCRTHGIPRRAKGAFMITVSIDGEEHGFTFTRK